MLFGAHGDKELARSALLVAQSIEPELVGRLNDCIVVTHVQATLWLGHGLLNEDTVVCETINDAFSNHTRSVELGNVVRIASLAPSDTPVERVQWGCAHCLDPR